MGSQCSNEQQQQHIEVDIKDQQINIQPQINEEDKPTPDFAVPLKELPSYFNELTINQLSYLPQFKYEKNIEEGQELPPYLLFQGDIYKGQWKDGKRFGKGKIFYKDGSLYEGQWVNDQPNGKGRLIYENGTQYEGYFQNNKCNGYGEIIYDDDLYYKGNWINNVRQGYGEEKLKDDILYKGNYVNNIRQGKGEYLWPDGRFYQGEINYCQMEGIGQMEWNNQRKYFGQFYKNDLNGFGVFQYPNGEKYMGFYEQNKKEGFGEFQFDQTKKYIGGFHDGFMHGEGKFYKNDIIRYGIWEQGKLIKDINQIKNQKLLQFIEKIENLNQDQILKEFLPQQNDTINDNTQQQNQSKNDNNNLNIQNDLQDKNLDVQNYLDNKNENLENQEQKNLENLENQENLENKNENLVNQEQEIKQEELKIQNQNQIPNVQDDKEKIENQKQDISINKQQEQIIKDQISQQISQDKEQNFQNQLKKNQEQKIQQIDNIEKPSLPNQINEKQEQVQTQNDQAKSFDVNELKGRKLYEQDLQKLGVEWIQESKPSENLKIAFENHNIYEDQEYVENKQYYENLVADYQKSVLNDLNQYQGQFYGTFDGIYLNLYCEEDIQEGALLGQIAGIIQEEKRSNSISFIYPSSFNDEQVFVECEHKSNIFGFAQKQVKGNVDIINYPHLNKWLILLVASKNISKGQPIILEIEIDLKELQEGGYQKKYSDFSNGKLLSNQDLDLFNITLLKENIYEDQTLKNLIDQNDIYEEEAFSNHTKNYDYLVFTKYHEIKNLKNSDDLIYIKFINEDMGYGIFAKNQINKGTIIGEYTGIVKQSTPNDSTYAWSIRSSFPEKGYSKIIISSLNKGNIFRFVNDYEYHNVQSLVIPIENRWRVFYQAKEDIKKDEELSVSYGKDYWSQRKQLDNTQA